MCQKPWHFIKALSKKMALVFTFVNLSQAPSDNLKMRLSKEHARILDKIQELYHDLFLHDGFGELKVEMKFLKKKQKEIIIRCGKDYRFVVDYDIQNGPGPKH
jgi:hypothetical protein